MFMNQTEVMNTLVTYATLHITGSIEMTLIAVLILFIVIGMAFRLPIYVTLLACIPLVLSFMAFESSLMGFGGIILLILGGILAMNWFFYR